MTETSSPSQSSVIEWVLRLSPRLAVFDCDGTLWSGDAGERFFDWELKRGVVSNEVIRWARARYAHYQEGKVTEDEMCGEMVRLHKGLKESDVLRLSAQFFEQHFLGRIFPEMRQLITELQKSGCDVWAVSSTNEWTIREAMEEWTESGLCFDTRKQRDEKPRDQLRRHPANAPRQAGRLRRLGLR